MTALASATGVFVNTLDRGETPSNEKKCGTRTKTPYSKVQSE